MNVRARQKLHLGVVGGGAWGTALAAAGARAGSPVLLWAREPAVVKDINTRRRNGAFLPQTRRLPAGIYATNDMDDFAICPVVLLVCPAQHMRATLSALAPHLARRATIVLCAKGVERKSLALMPEVAEAILPRTRLAVLAGPSFAHEVAAGLPAALTCATRSAHALAAVRDALESPMFRLYASRDPLGAALGGAVKNVLAIACGIAEGKNLGANARAALITRGLAELARLGAAMGARASTMMGLSGVGDVVLTCSSESSRNFSLGLALGRGRSVGALMRAGKSVKEGAHSASALVRLARRHKVEMPICRAVAKVIDGGTVDKAIGGLLARDTGEE